MLISNSNSAATSLLDNINSVVGIVGPSIAALALIAGGIWAYFKFAKGRTFKDRLQVDLDGWWHIADGRHLIQARVTLKNIGSSRVLLLHDGTGLKVSRLAAPEYQLPGRVAWLNLEKARIFGEHEWIEPGETVSDDILLDLKTSQPIIALFEVLLVCRRDEVFARRIIPANSTANATMHDTSATTVRLAGQDVQGSEEGHQAQLKDQLKDEEGKEE